MRKFKGTERNKKELLQKLATAPSEEEEECGSSNKGEEVKERKVLLLYLYLKVKTKEESRKEKGVKWIPFVERPIYPPA